MTRARSAAAAATAAATAPPAVNKQREPVVVDLEMNDEEEEVVEAAGEEDENAASANGGGNEIDDAGNEEEDVEVNETIEEDGDGDGEGDVDGEEENEEEAEGGAEEFGDHEDDAEHVDGMEEAEGEEKETEEESKPVPKKEVSKDPLDRPPHGSEVFLGGIGRDVSDDEVREFCLPCGEVYEVRLVVDRETGQCKGYGFVTFMNKDSAQKAIETLNDTEFKGKKIRVTPSQSKHRLFIGNIPKLWTKEELLKALSEESAGIESVDLLQDPSNPHKNRGFAFVEYYNHAAAEQARRVLSKQSFLLGGRTPTVNYAENRTEPDAAAMAQVKVVYVRNLPESVTEDDLRKLFEKHGDITKIILPIPKPGQPKRDFGFIHFAERSSAVAAIDKDEKYEVDGRALECSLAKPPAEKRAPPPPESSYPVRGGTAGLLPQYQPQRSATYAYQAAGAHAGYGHVGVRAYAAAQPVIYGRGPTPAGMTMVPMMLPDGTVGYVLQQPGQMQPAAAYRRAGTQNMITYAHSGAPIGRQDRRYRPY